MIKHKVIQTHKGTKEKKPSAKDKTCAFSPIISYTVVNFLSRNFVLYIIIYISDYN